MQEKQQIYPKVERILAKWDSCPRFFYIFFACFKRCCSALTLQFGEQSEKALSFVPARLSSQ
jgi:hypothetical protein